MSKPMMVRPSFLRSQTAAASTASMSRLPSPSTTEFGNGLFSPSSKLEGNDFKLISFPHSKGQDYKAQLECGQTSHTRQSHNITTSTCFYFFYFKFLQVSCYQCIVNLKTHAVDKLFQSRTQSET